MTRRYLLEELSLLRERLQILEPSLSDKFFFQLDQQQYLFIQGAYQCDLCARFLCRSCFQEIGWVNVTKCPFCGGEIRDVEF